MRAKSIPGLSVARFDGILDLLLEASPCLLRQRDARSLLRLRFRAPVDAFEERDSEPAVSDHSLLLLSA